jgi:DNA-binding transcriptional LysR family regulator
MNVRSTMGAMLVERLDRRNAEISNLGFGNYKTWRNRRMRFDLVDLRLFLYIAEAWSVTHGAERSNLALGSASGRIRGMEEALGIPLLARDRRGVSLTAAGQSLVEHARLITQPNGCDLISACLRVGSLAASRCSEHGRVQRVLAESAGQVSGRQPHNHLDIEERESADIGAAIASGAADVSIASIAALPDTLEQFPFKDLLVVVITRGDPLGQRRQLAFADVVDAAFVGLPRDSALQRHINGHATRLGATLNVRARVTSFDAVCRMVEARVGLGIVPVV